MPGSPNRDDYGREFRPVSRCGPRVRADDPRARAEDSRARATHDGDKVLHP